MVTLFSFAAAIRPSSSWSVYQADSSIWTASICATGRQLYGIRYEWEEKGEGRTLAGLPEGIR